VARQFHINFLTDRHGKSVNIKLGLDAGGL